MLKKNKRIEDPDLLKYIKENLPCIGCGSPPPNDVHHVISRGAGGNDIVSNLMPLCRMCHEKIHRLSLSVMARKVPSVKEWLNQAGWVYDNYVQKWKPPR